MCRTIGWSCSSVYYRRVHECLLRLKATAVAIENRRLGGCAITHLEWLTYRDLTPIARRLYRLDYAASHQQPHPIKLETFQQLCRAETSASYKWRQQVRSACAELIEAGLLASAEVDKQDLVRLQRHR